MSGNDGLRWFGKRNAKRKLDEARNENAKCEAQKETRNETQIWWPRRALPVCRAMPLRRSRADFATYARHVATGLRRSRDVFATPLRQSRDAFATVARRLCDCRATPLRLSRDAFATVARHLCDCRATPLRQSRDTFATVARRFCDSRATSMRPAHLQCLAFSSIHLPSSSGDGTCNCPIYRGGHDFPGSCTHVEESESRDLVPSIYNNNFNDRYTARSPAVNITLKN